MHAPVPLPSPVIFSGIVVFAEDTKSLIDGSTGKGTTALVRSRYRPTGRWRALAGSRQAHGVRAEPPARGPGRAKLAVGSGRDKTPIIPPLQSCAPAYRPSGGARCSWHTWRTLSASSGTCARVHGWVGEHADADWAHCACQRSPSDSPPGAGRPRLASFQATEAPDAGLPPARRRPRRGGGRRPPPHSKSLTITAAQIGCTHAPDRAVGIGLLGRMTWVHRLEPARYSDLQGARLQP